MRRLAALFLASLLLAASFASAQTPSELAETAGFVARHQNDDGGFGARPGDASTLGATSSAIRVLKYTGGSIPDVPKCIKYVRSCVVDGGAFAPNPGGEPDVRTTAVGLMALAELGIASDDLVEPAVAYLSENSEGFADIRIAVAGLEAVGKTAPKLSDWVESVRSTRNSDGTWGEGDGIAFDTGGTAVALLRMGQELDHKDAVIEAIVDGQRDDGGWAAADGPSTLSDSYRVMRCVSMLKADADLDRLLSFIARHRQESGGYAAAPDQPADLSNTYYAAIMIRWARELRGEPRLVETAGFVSLFNGKDLAGWEGDTSLWKVQDGMIVGESSGLDHNDFLATKSSYGDFVLRLTFQMTGGDDANSGIQFRSERIPGHEMRGYQADIGQGYWGSLYDESRRNRVLVEAREQAIDRINHDGWNEYVIRAIGGNIRLSLNGVESVNYDERDPEIARDGKIALQLHAGGPFTIRFKDIYLQRLPSPKAAETEQVAQSPGFHLKTVDASDGTRKYTVYVPEGYDGTERTPVVLFLHGAGERGEDGIVPAQVGLGPAILRDPASFPAIAVFPQARQTWAAGSADAQAAIAALDDVIESYKVDEDRIVLTGLSMGGHGSWDNFAAHADRFAAVAVICGFTREPDAIVDKVKDKPIWMVVGDADMPFIFASMREMVDKLRATGADLHSIEYRGVGHNSWDRAYNDPALIEWMLSQGRASAE